MRTGKSLIALVPVAALVLGGCGGGGGETTTTAATTTEAPPALSKAELIQQGDGICAEVNAAVGTVNASEAESSDQVSQAADLYSGMVERLKGLGTPEEDAGYTEFIEAADQLAQAESNAQLASQRGDESALASAQAKAASALETFQAGGQRLRLRRMLRSAQRPLGAPNRSQQRAAPAQKKPHRSKKAHPKKLPHPKKQPPKKSPPKRAAPEALPKGAAPVPAAAKKGAAAQAASGRAERRPAAGPVGDLGNLSVGGGATIEPSECGPAEFGQARISERAD